METGHCAQQIVDQKPKHELDPAQILLLFTVVLNVQEKVLRNRIATLKTARFMADGVTMERGQSALTPVEEEPKHEPELAQILPLLTAGLNVTEMTENRGIAILTLAQVFENI